MPGGRTGRRAAVAAAILVAGVVLVLVVISSASMSPPPTPPPVRAGGGEDAARMARGACMDMRDVEALVGQDAPAPRVLRYVRAAVSDISGATATDPTWRSLQSGITAIQQGFHTDNGAMTTLGIAIVRDQCRRTGLQLAHFDGLHT